MVTFEDQIPYFIQTNTPLALTIGVFDGVHRGHVELIKNLVNKARQRNLKTGILSFHPHPNQVLEGSSYKGDLLLKKERMKQLEVLGIDFLFLQDFSVEFSELSREDFLRHYLQKYLNPQFLLFGYDFKFGKKGLGNFEFAKKELKNIDVEQAKPFYEGEEIISSSKIRSLLIQGDIKKANHLLGYPYKLTSRVQKGLQLGRKVGFPTANFSEVKTLLPKQGVYAGFLTCNGKRYQSVMNIGKKPTVQKTNEINCECHILNFNGDLYGQDVSFEFIDFLREEKKFTNIEFLKKQIVQDINKAKKVLGEP